MTFDEALLAVQQGHEVSRESDPTVSIAIIDERIVVLEASWWHRERRDPSPEERNATDWCSVGFEIDLGREPRATEAVFKDPPIFGTHKP